MKEDEIKTNPEETPVIEEELEELETLDSGEDAIVEDELVDDIVSLERQLEEQKSKAEEYLDGWQRARAEFANYKKRNDKEKAQISQQSVNRISKQYLSAVDDLDRALKESPTDEEGATWANGIELIYRKLLKIMENEGIIPMDAEGEMFDPVFHEALSSEPNPDFESGQIIEVIQQGYMQNDAVLRPALVRVAQ